MPKSDLQRNLLHGTVLNTSYAQSLSRAKMLKSPIQSPIFSNAQKLGHCNQRREVLKPEQLRHIHLDYHDFFPMHSRQSPE